MNVEFLKKWGLFGLVLFFMAAIIVGCGIQEQNSPDEPSVTESDVEEEKSDSGDSDDLFPVTITDDAGREVTIETEPESIVSIQASNTEITFALGLGDKVIGVSDFCNYPAEALEVEKVGGQDMNAELVLTLLPDIALVTDYHYNTHPDILEQYEEAGINVVVVGSSTSFDDVYDKIEMIATVTGSQSAGGEIISDMKERHDAIKEQAEELVTEQKKVWVEVSPAPDIFTTGQNTFMHEMLESIQAINAAEEQEGWVTLTEEEIVQLNPDVIITTYGYYVENPRDDVLARDGWAEVPAIKNEQVYDVDNDTVTRPGPRLIEGVETLAKLIYPDVFEQ
ncbi:ABC transporter substrate-binding protein [Alkalihalobacillus sp. MEB130]|uniref:ABC transporter substrate-binding protein n=1 Tax=Alkalihalobacillus sp. MEB130 TaxID=2976704 RepID=UPI0028DEFC43|nr:ABC transporter substrate-binding protein [Alkalihalobacillus sp. MEB130]MDT8859301.1 ABC transporter substrate-binding protein [Alkalihalobacillus sp. MEB130]